MNIAFPALLIFLFILPGLIFNLAFYKTESTPLKDVSFTLKAFISSTVAIILHVIGLLIICFFHYSVDIPLILILISGVQGDKFALAVTSITFHEIITTAFYLGFLYFIAYLIGKSLRWCIRFFKLDRKFDFFRIDSPWYYLFTGYDWKDGKPDGVRIAAVVEIASNTYLYIGWLDKFYFDCSGNIDRLVLTNAMRREIKHDKDKSNKDDVQDRFYPIDGHYFVLKYAEVKNLNVQFLKAIKKSQQI